LLGPPSPPPASLLWTGETKHLMSTYWRDRARMPPAIPVCADGGVPSDKEVHDWRYIHEQAEKERERELQAMATADELYRRQEAMAWLLKTRTDAERELAKNPAVEPAGADDVGRQMLMRSLVAKHGGDEDRADEEFAKIVADDAGRPAFAEQKKRPGRPSVKADDDERFMRHMNTHPGDMVAVEAAFIRELSGVRAKTAKNRFWAARARGGHAPVNP
jgi:hypothetical protein